MKKSLDDEIQHLTQSFESLRLAQSKFRDCLKSLASGLSPKTHDRAILVPLTSSLYVPGKLADTERVIVDVGTGFYVEKSVKDAAAFYESKVKDLEGKLGGLEKVIQSKGQSLGVVEDEIRQKVVAQNASASSSASVGSAATAAAA